MTPPLTFLQISDVHFGAPLTAGRLALPESVAQERTEGFGNPMFLLGKILNALLLSPIETDLSRLHLVNTLIENGRQAYGDDFLDRINEVGATHGQRPIQRIESLVVRPSRDLGVLAGEGGDRRDR